MNEILSMREKRAKLWDATKAFVESRNGTQYSRITAAKNGDTFDWVATAENGWHAVVVNGCVGWVSGKYSKIA